jgi:hypothetical protein
MKQELNLTADQRTALCIIEMAQQNMLTAANMCAGPLVNMKPAGAILAEACKALDAAKMSWIQTTQQAVQLVSVIPSKLELAK